MKNILKNINAVLRDGVIKTDIVITDGIISHIGNVSDTGDDYSGMFAFPGFTDVHTHGAFGTEFASAECNFEDGLVKYAERGVTSVCCTVRCLPVDEICSVIKHIVSESKSNRKGAVIRGIHLEGPFISPKHIGSMNPTWIAEPKRETVRKFYELSEGLLKIITVAPELENAVGVIDEAVKLGVKVSVGHTDATEAECKNAFAHGASRLTHTFNAMRGFHHREVGPIGAGITDDNISCEAICDFVHLTPTAIKLLMIAKGEDKIEMISDSGVFSGLGDMEIVIAGKKRIIKDGVCKTVDGIIAGSCFTLEKGVQNLIGMGYDMSVVSKLASLNPAKTLGADQIIGSLEVGKRADICILDENLNPHCGFVGGVCYGLQNRS